MGAFRHACYLKWSYKVRLLRKFPWSTAAASWERHPFSSRLEKGENVLPHTSSLIYSKNSSVNLSGKWDSSDSTVAGEDRRKRRGKLGLGASNHILLDLLFLHLFFWWPDHDTLLNACKNADELSIAFTEPSMSEERKHLLEGGFH